MTANERQRSARQAVPPARDRERSGGARPHIGSRGLRSQIVIVLSLVLLPAAIISGLWTWSQYRHLRTIKLAGATRAAERVAADINEFLRNNSVVAATQFARTDPAVSRRDRCEVRLSDVLRERREYSFAAVLVDDAVICVVDTGAHFVSDDDARAEVKAMYGRLLARPAGENGSTFLPLPDERLLILGARVRSAADEAPPPPAEERRVFVITGLRTNVLSYTIGAMRLGIDRGSAILSADGDVIARSSTPAIGDNWFPDGPSTLADAIGRLPPGENFAAQSQSGEQFRYFLASTVNPDLLVLTGYPETLLFASERSVLWSSLAPLLLMLAVATVGTLWVTERLVVRWITYLQRVTRVYGSGRLSVRAVRIGNAPRELAELGTAFNEMAANVASYARQLEHAAVEKDTLLRELHHRVKNNFQVIVSLLSLHKRAADAQARPTAPAEGDGLRFIEDHVQAMSVAYRVGYSSGDMGETPLAELMHDVIDCLRRTADMAEADIVEIPPAAGHVVDLDRAIGIALYLAALLPAYLDAVKRAAPDADGRTPKATVSAEVATAGPASGPLRLAIGTVPGIAIAVSPLQERLARAYIRQLGATSVDNGEPSRRTIVIPLDRLDANPGR
ncbi:signal transduction histidine kinase [Pseudochelatococcus lubricantis]|uniref:Signal transduction histidine kinase n=1 Tax=Pseudochelatococcus lubricantis TaxID=1538102 RepID=A0ABX0UW23_9HYPH|nr:signal transduction histidine kinase [Pseudochelatococcus lubricantis]